MPSKSVISYYVRRLRPVLGARGRVAGFLVASAVHAAGYGLVALVAAAVTLSLAERLGLHAPSSGLPFNLPSGVSTRSTMAGPLADKALCLSVMGLAVVVVKGLAGAYATFVQAWVGGQVGSELRLELLDALLAIHRLQRPRHGDHGSAQPGHAKGQVRDPSDRPDPPVGPVAAAVVALTDRVREIEAGLEQGLLGAARATAQLLPIIALLIALSARMAAVAAVILTVFGWALGRARGGYRFATQRATRYREQLLEAADEAVRHADLWVTYGAEAKARMTARALGERIAEGSARLQARGVALSSANEVLGAAALVVAIAASRRGWLGPVSDGTTLLSFAVAFFLAYRPLRELADARLAIARAQTAYDEVTRVVETADAPVPEAALPGDADHAPQRVWPLAEIELRSLRLARGTCEPLSLRIEAGSVAVLIGRTGAGKTTLLRTLLGLERSLDGDIVFGGDSLVDAPAGPKGRPFAWVPQDAPLLADTLQANVALGAPGVDARRVLEGLGAAHLGRSLDDARLGVGGRAVSGGERQWIALARAIATRQPVLLLDEPTSGLDADAQQRVLEAIAHLRGRRTVLIVTHRPEPLAIADLVVRIDVGGLVEKAA